jgi:hypothetical protein
VPAEPNTKLIAEDQTQTTAGKASASASLGAADFWAAGLAAFKAASGSGSGSPPSASQGQLSASALSFNFGNVNIGSNSSHTITLSNSGTANVTISNVSVFGAGMNASGVVGLVLTPKQTATLTVTFAPASTVSVSGSVTVTSNAANSPMSITLSGTGVQTASYSVALVWSPISGVAGYNVYRGSVSGGPYTLITNAPVTTTTFTDTNVQSGQTYYYAVTSLNSVGVQSNYSNPASATIP